MRREKSMPQANQWGVLRDSSSGGTEPRLGSLYRPAERTPEEAEVSGTSSHGPAPPNAPPPPQTTPPPPTPPPTPTGDSPELPKNDPPPRHHHHENARNFGKFLAKVSLPNSKRDIMKTRRGFERGRNRRAGGGGGGGGGL